MTAAEIKALKEGDAVSYVCAHCGTTVTDAVRTVRMRGAGSGELDGKLQPWVVVSLSRTKTTVTLESDEYIRSFGPDMPTHDRETGQRIRGADLVQQPGHSYFSGYKP